MCTESEEVAYLLSLICCRKKGRGAAGPQAITFKLWSCSFIVSCSTFSSWAHRLFASATRSSLPETSGLLESGPYQFSRGDTTIYKYASVLLTWFQKLKNNYLVGWFPFIFWLCPLLFSFCECVFDLWLPYFSSKLTPSYIYLLALGSQSYSLKHIL